MITNRAPITMNDLEPVRDTLDRILIKQDQGWKTLITGNLKDSTALNNSGLDYTGPVFIKQGLLDILKKDALFISIIGLILVNIILLYRFQEHLLRRPQSGPGIREHHLCARHHGAFRHKPEFMNAIVFVILVGIGTDYTVPPSPLSL